MAESTAPSSTPGDDGHFADARGQHEMYVALDGLFIFHQAGGNAVGGDVAERRHGAVAIHGVEDAGGVLRADTCPRDFARCAAARMPKPTASPCR